ATHGTRDATSRCAPSCATEPKDAVAPRPSARASSPSQEHLPLAAVRREGREDAAVLHEHELVEVLRHLTRLHVAEPDAVADAQVARVRARDGGLRLARALTGKIGESFGPHRARQTVVAGRSGCDPTPSEHGRDVG